ncbi:MAG: membrane protein insertion efficiency factor YidD [Hyphomicrobiales bacterium]|nr:membrane protein insertion efficiency factor YidD [Hyphomicrobiales bacterium]
MCASSQNHRFWKARKASLSSAAAELPASGTSPLALVAIGFVQLYRHSFSALLGRQCRYLPTCSEYALDALRLHGFWAGWFMALARLCRCGPFGGHGYDPVPLTLPASARWWLPWRYGAWRGPCDTDNGDLTN